ncbi:MAG: hypothetical protein N3A68_01920 [Bacteroidia bacterium]|nr:hypothetical protein [Bacteroidia bacterium]GIV23309.1 MAG: hypothetical protein KatS3mg025_0968 [Bacteroidia bacterium]
MGKTALLWSKIGLSLCLGQLPARYVLKADALGFLWREQRLTAEYRLFRWAPPLKASVERARWDGLTLTLNGSYYRRLPLRGGVLRSGVRYYPLRPAYAPEGLWVGLHGTLGLVAPVRETPQWQGGPGLSLGYQHIFHQAYGGVIEPYLLLDFLFGRYKNLMPFQVGLHIGFAARKWNRRNIP